MFVDGINLKTEFDLSTRNLPTVGYISQEGLNVNDLLKYEFVCFSKDGLEQFVERIANGKK